LVFRTPPGQTAVLNVERVQALEHWLKTTNTKLIQVNGQRKYGGPPDAWDGPIPEARCEVFISHIPRDTYEDVLIPLFSSVGPLWEFRLMMNFSGQNRGFAYAKYGTAALATEAIRVLHGFILEPGCYLSVRRSTEKRHLCIGHLPAATRQEDLLQVMRMLAEGVERVSLKAEPGIKGVSAIVAFTSHHAASMAKKVLVEEFKKSFSLDVSIKWLSVERSNTEELWCKQKVPRSLLPQKISQPSALPPHLAHSPLVPQRFCRTVGGPTSLLHPQLSSSAQAFAESPVMLLRKMCEASGLGLPVFEVFCSHTGPDGFLNVTYKVHVPGMNASFQGMGTILPGPNPSTTLQEAKKTVAQQVLQRVFNTQLTV
uniref:DND microRNA-mediated repression inhibitor 1 n=1 Tax=Kryptolebias marmoratus TaxID=37003 RepID=A0A3Q3EK10_KRYMA